MLKEAQTSILTDFYPKNADGYQNFKQFIDKDYYERYVPKPPTEYEICELKDPD